MAGCLGQELEAAFFPSQSGCLLNTPHSALGASFKGFPQNPLDRHLLPRRNPQAEAEAGLHGTFSSWVLFASNCGAPEGDHICTAGSAPRGHSTLPTPRSAARAPGHPRAFLFSGPAGSLRASALSSSPGEAREPEFAGPEEAASQLQTGRPPAWGQRSPAWGAAQRGQRAGPGLLRGPGPFTAPADSGQLSGGRARPGRLKVQKGRGAGRTLRLPVA